ncbi:MAG: hypothetical protein K2L87_01840, partial [Clostridiales bacterium]|nr:hypothetical protein [Clostridiales bacterium]
VAADGIITIGGFTLEGWHFGESMNSHVITVLPSGVQSTVSYTYATVADREGLAAGSVTATEVSDKYNVHTFTANPVNAGWYIVRAQAVGATNSAVAYYLFRIEKAEVEAPALTVNAQNSKYSGAVLTVSVTYATTAFMSSDTTWSGSNGSATLSATNQGSYHATFNLVNSANYTWKSGIRTGNLVSIDGVTRLSLAIEGDALVYTWTVIPATDNTVSWSYGVVNGENVSLENGLAITYGDEFTLNTSSRYLSATISLEYAPRGENDTQAPATGWSTNKAYLGGNYWVRVRSRSSNGNFNDAQATLKLTINKKALNIRVTGSLVYGQAFDEGRFAYEIVDSLTSAEMSRITGTPVAYTLSTGSLDRNKLTVRTYALTLGSKTENGIAVVDGLSSNDFYFPVANVSGTLTVSKASILVQIGNAASYYSEAIDYTSAIEGLQLIGGSLADWESDTDLNELLKPTVVSDVNETSNVGNYAIRCTAYDNGNYDVTFYNGIYRVEQLRIRIEISSGGGTYGDEVIEGARVTGIFKESDDAPITDAELKFSYIYTGVSNDGTWRYENGLSTSECPTLAGTYTATAVNPENENYLLVGTSSVPFVVAKMSIDADAITVPNQAYTGNALSPSIIDDVYNVDGQEIYRVRPVSNCVNAGTYQITLVMNDFANMKWLGSDVEERT